MVTQFYRDDKTSESYINGVKVTDENYELLIKDDIRCTSTYIMRNAIREVKVMWAGRLNVPERDRIIAILEQAIIHIEHG